MQLGDERRIKADVGDLTWYYLERTFTSRVAHNLFWGPLVNTLSVAFGAIVDRRWWSAATLAWLLARTDMFGRRWFATALIVPYMLPAWTFALAWTTLFKNRTVGGQAGWLEALGFTPPDWLAYGRLPVTIILALHYSPFIILLFGNALRRFDSPARGFGAHPRRRAADGDAADHPAADAAGADVGDGADLRQVPRRVRRALRARPAGRTSTCWRPRSTRTSRRGRRASRRCSPASIMLIGVITLTIDAQLMREARRFVTIGSKGSMDRLSPLGRLRWPATVFAALMFVLSVGLPLLTLFLSTVMKVPARFTLDNFTLDYWIGTDLNTVALQTGILLSPDLWNAAWNSLRIVGVASLTSGLLGLLVGYVVVRTPVRPLATFLRQVTFLPYLVPGHRLRHRLPLALRGAARADPGALRHDR